MAVSVQSVRTPSREDLTLVVGGFALAGWESASANLHVEGFPNSFQVALSAIDPASGLRIEALPGSRCELRAGADVLLTGYIDQATNGADSNSHGLTISGRGLTADLVDCSAELPSGALNFTNTLALAQAVAKPYGLTVRELGAVEADEHIPTFLLTYGETGADIIQRIARNASLLVYEGTDGAIVLAHLGTTRAASGAIYGENVESWSVETSWMQRYSEIVCIAGPIDQLQAVQGPDPTTSDGGGFTYYTAKDPELIAAGRHRRLYLPTEAAVNPLEFTKHKAEWDMSRRIGRSVVVRVTVDSWRDGAGTLWAPNTLVPVEGPGLNLVDKFMLLAEVTFRQGNDGTHADLTLLPPAAFAPEPIALLQANPAITPGLDVR